jgi:hypothetical protein
VITGGNKDLIRQSIDSVHPEMEIPEHYSKAGCQWMKKGARQVGSFFRTQRLSFHSPDFLNAPKPGDGTTQG